jgi:hypothetical protein
MTEQSDRDDLVHAKVPRVQRMAVYAHDAHCNTIHRPGPGPCPPERPGGDTVHEALERAWDMIDWLLAERAACQRSRPSRKDLKRLKKLIRAREETHVTEND